MKNRLFFLLITILTTIDVKAQKPEDALRNAWFIPGGTARTIAIGGAMGSLGGDITANNVNPAGNSIGHYNGTVVFDQSGAWRIKIRLTKNTLFYDTYFDITY